MMTKTDSYIFWFRRHNENRKRTISWFSFSSVSQSRFFLYATFLYFGKNENRIPLMLLIYKLIFISHFLFMMDMNVHHNLFYRCFIVISLRTIVPYKYIILFIKSCKVFIYTKIYS